MSAFKAIQLALDSRLRQISLPWQIAWENIAFKPTPGTPWIRPTVLNADSDRLNLDGIQNNQGIYQIDAFYPASKGVGSLLDAIDSIYELFSNDQVLYFDNREIKISTVSKKPSTIDDIWFKGSVEIGFYSYF